MIYLLVILVVSLAGITGLLALRAYEDRRGGRVFLRTLRERADAATRRGFRRARRIPARATRHVARSGSALVQYAGVAVARGIVYLQHLLAHAGEFLSQRTRTIRASGGVSHFIETVAEHKRRLSREREGANRSAERNPNDIDTTPHA